MFFGARDAWNLLDNIVKTKFHGDNSFIIAQVNYDLGVLCLLKGRPSEACGYFQRARIGAEGQGATELLKKIDSALQGLKAR